MPIVTLTTDFGHQDHYVGAMKGVILGLAPKATLVDITHDVRAYDIVHGAFVLRQIWPYYPAGTIHVAVVDPGVGTDRRILVGRYSGRIIIAPDNGLVTLIHRDAELEDMRAAENNRLWPRMASSTFHGRDVMAPIAGHLARGTKLEDVGPSTDHVDMLRLPVATLNRDQSVTGEVLFVDGFGSLVTNISRRDIALVHKRRPDAGVVVGETSAGPIRQTYGDVAVGEPLALVGSSDVLEISVNQGRAVDHFQWSPGTAIHIR
jgi:hypothetical protein